MKKLTRGRLDRERKKGYLGGVLPQGCQGLCPLVCCLLGGGTSNFKLLRGTSDFKLLRGPLTLNLNTMVSVRWLLANILDES